MFPLLQNCAFVKMGSISLLYFSMLEVKTSVCDVLQYVTMPISVPTGIKKKKKNLPSSMHAFYYLPV